MNALAIQAGLPLHVGQGTFRVIVVTPGPATLVIDRDPEVPVLGVIGLFIGKASE